jgi:phosphohistidine phosphatase
MDLTLVRHAIAEPGEDDAARPLSPKGKRRFREVVQGLDALGLRFERVLHSPALRALQTAELLGPVSGSLEVSTLLAKEPSLALLKALTGGSVALVGHEPWLSRLLAWLTTGEAKQGHLFVLRKGGVALLEGTPEPGGMRLAGLLPPKVLRRARR